MTFPAVLGRLATSGFRLRRSVVVQDTLTGRILLSANSSVHREQRCFTSDADYDEFLSTTSKARKPSAIRSLQPLVNLPGMISLGGGMPNAATFPFEKLTMQCTSGLELTLSGKALEEALQYSPTPGLPALNAFLMEHLIMEEHAPPERTGVERALTITQGSQDGLSKVFDMLLDADDALLVESPTYSGSLAYLQPKGVRLIEMETDEGGLIPDNLEATLRHWDDSTSYGDDGPRPKVLYTIPTGGNPTGASLSLQRKKRIYEIASEFNLLILEDDPYYYLRLEGDSSKHPSFLELDTDARVIRFDSFSKILSSGMRIGFVTGPKPLIERVNLHTQASNLHPTGVTQAMVLALLESWGKEGWKAHLEGVCAFYRSQRNHFLSSAERHLAGLVEWNAPDAGMFIWMKLLGVDDAQELIETKAVESGVLLVPGSVFLPNPRQSPYVRAAYSTASPQDMDTALERLAFLLEGNESSNNNK